ncbi:MAG: hypothetical protein GY786_00710 [Proteobacteria bacterium]|nr:hypothetical protein [Pseudomonadota bacterium]
MIKLWIHESERVYGDRLVSSADLAKFNQCLFEVVKKNFCKFSL